VRTAPFAATAEGFVTPFHEGPWIDELRSQELIANPAIKIESQRAVIGESLQLFLDRRCAFFASCFFVVCLEHGLRLCEWVSGSPTRAALSPKASLRVRSALCFVACARRADHRGRSRRAGTAFFAAFLEFKANRRAPCSGIGDTLSVAYSEGRRSRSKSFADERGLVALEVGAQEVDSAVDSDRSREPRGAVGHPAAQRASAAPQFGQGRRSRNEYFGKIDHFLRLVRMIEDDAQCDPIFFCRYLAMIANYRNSFFARVRKQDTPRLLARGCCCLISCRHLHIFHVFNILALCDVNLHCR
jgi:hypothetical protein